MSRFLTRQRAIDPGNARFLEPEMLRFVMADAVAHRLAAIFAADVAGYSRLMEENEEETLRQLTYCREVMDHIVADHRGRIVNSVGDSVLAEFGSTTDALEAAIAIQEMIGATTSGKPPA